MESKALISEIRRSIIRVVKVYQGIKATELAVQVVSNLYPLPFEHKDFDAALTMLVQEGEIVAIEYTLPELDRVKSMLFPKGTNVWKVDSKQQPLESVGK